MTLDPDIQKRAEEWTKAPFDAETRDEIQQLIDNGDAQELYERFYTDLEFGTGGLRGIMGAGLNRMNRYTVGRATQGLANYIRKTLGEGDERSVAIAHDSRINSEEFTRDAACVLAANGIRVHVFKELRPTPLLSFAVRHLGATSGIVITASHNPKEYNGYKVYWDDGGQIVPPHDKGIIEEVRKIDDFATIQTVDYDEAVADGRIHVIDTEVDEAYFEAILPLSVQPDVCRNVGDGLRILYTPLHGTGVTLVPEGLRRWGFQNVAVCKAQKTPDGTFPTAASPNPEEKSALEEAIKEAKATGANLVLATDPDADRVGIAVEKDGEFVLVNGNQVATMIVEYVLSMRAERGTLPNNAAVVKTIVTTEWIADVCRRYGVRLDDTLTGFKYIGEKIREYETSGDAQFQCGGEESYGYLVGTHARDKDAVVSSCFIAEMAADSAARGETLLDRLDRLSREYGLYKTSLESMRFPGSEGQDKIKRLMASFRQSPPKAIGDSAVVELRDYQEDRIVDTRTGEKTGETGLPKSNVLLFRTEDGAQVVGRPSGTEPKIKFYFSVSDRCDLPIAPENLATRRQALETRHDAVRADFLKLVDAAAS